MSRRQKITVIAFAALALFVAIAALVVSRIDIKPRFESIASRAIGMDVAVSGNVSIHLLPQPHVRLEGVTIKNAKAEIARVRDADLGLEFWPLLRQRLRIRSVILQGVVIDLVRQRDGHFNFEAESRNERTIPATNVGRVTLSKVAFRYRNQQTDKEVSAKDCEFESRDVQLQEGTGREIMKHLSLTAQIDCSEMRNDLFVGTNVKATAVGQAGHFKLAPLTMRMMGGNGAGVLDADYTDKVPSYRLRYSVTRLTVDDLFKSLSPDKTGEGFLDFSTDLTMRGFNAAELTRSAHGEAAMHGKQLEITIGDLDDKLSRYESSQNFNLVDLGAFFIAGPLGAVVTKGYNFASVFKDRQGNTQIRNLVSHWKVQDGVAQAQDVAMLTHKNRLAMHGKLDFVTKRFDDVTVAVIDDRGCPTIEQKIRGPFSNPEVVKPNVLVSLTGPFTRVVRRMKRAIGVKCEVFYDGSISPPK